MPRGRFKRRGYHQNGLKRDGITLSMDLCPYCYSYGCDPMAMSMKFQQEIRERLRKGLCPSCGEPKEFCKCKSSMKIVAGVHTIRTHNNKHLRKARAKVAAKEAAYTAWLKHELAFSRYLGEDACASIERALYHHELPPVPWAKVKKMLLDIRLPIQDVLVAGWMP